MSNQSITAEGRCLCGKVTYQASLKSDAGACHCGMCRQWSAGPFMSVQVDGNLNFFGEENISTYRSSEWAERGFCKLCGSNLYYRLLPRAECPDGDLRLSAGTVTVQNGLAFKHEVFVDNAPDWYRFANEAERHRMTESQLLAKYELVGK